MGLVIREAGHPGEGGTWPESVTGKTEGDPSPIPFCQSEDSPFQTTSICIAAGYGSRNLRLVKGQESETHTDHCATTAENSEVLFIGSVAVAVTKLVPFGGSGPKKVNAAKPAPFVFTLWEPRK
jgi:hypothetical protein